MSEDIENTVLCIVCGAEMLSYSGDVICGNCSEISRLKSELIKERARANQFFDGMTKAEAELDEQRKYISCLEGNVEDTKALEAQVASLSAKLDKQLEELRRLADTEVALKRLCDNKDDLYVSIKAHADRLAEILEEVKLQMEHGSDGEGFTDLECIGMSNAISEKIINYRKEMGE